MLRRTLARSFWPLLVLAVLGAACGRRAAPRELPLVEVERSDVELTASADGVVEPVRTVEVKSKASGEIIALPVDTGDRVDAGQVLVQLLPRDAQNAYEQARADLEAADARLANARLHLERARRLHEEGLIPPSELEAAELAATGARTDVVRTQKSLDNAAERLAETTVRSPIAGTVIGKSVEVGQVVSSAVSQVSGGTLLLTLADLAEVQVRSLVDEVDIGRVAPGMPVEIRVEAYPERRFEGELVKIEPQAVVEQNVTMFPVLTRIDNSEGLLKPGMNAEVEVEIARREGVVAVPNEALKRPEEARMIAALLGIDTPDDGTGGGGADAVPRRRGGPGEDARATGRRRRGGPTDVMVAFVSADGGYRLQTVRTGLRNWDATEVVSGLEPGERVALVPSAAQLRQSQELRERIQQVRGMPGMSGGRRQQGGGS